MTDRPTPTPADRLRVLIERAARHLAPAEGEQLRTLASQFVAGRETWRAKAEEIERDRDRLRAERDRARSTAVAPEQDGARIAAELAAHENAPVLRNCLVPTCLCQFDVAAHMDSCRPLARPEWSGKGWQQVRPGVPLASGYVCPAHSDLVAAHVLRRLGPMPEGWTATVCGCGWSSGLRRWHGAVRGMWEEHLIEMGGLLPGSPRHTGHAPATQPHESPDRGELPPGRAAAARGRTAAQTYASDT